METEKSKKERQHDEKIKAAIVKKLYDEEKAEDDRQIVELVKNIKAASKPINGS